MRAVVQRVSKCELSIEGAPFSSIGIGLVVLLGIEEFDTNDDIEWLSAKIDGLRIFDDEQGAMNLDVHDIDGEIMIVSQFTLHASTRKGQRPSFLKAAKPDLARPLYEAYVKEAQSLLGKDVATGQFAAHMQVDLVNDGPVTILLDSKFKE